MDAGLSGGAGPDVQLKGAEHVHELVSLWLWFCTSSEPLPDWCPHPPPLFGVLDGLNSGSPNRFQDLVLHLRVETAPPLAEALPRLQLGKNSVGNLSGLIHLVTPLW
jgi:hypothetical protein